jgi:hypothetical protein
VDVVVFVVVVFVFVRRRTFSWEICTITDNQLILTWLNLPNTIGLLRRLDIPKHCITSATCTNTVLGSQRTFIWPSDILTWLVHMVEDQWQFHALHCFYSLLIGVGIRIWLGAMELMTWR